MSDAFTAICLGAINANVPSPAFVAVTGPTLVRLYYGADRALPNYSKPSDDECKAYLRERYAKLTFTTDIEQIELCSSRDGPDSVDAYVAVHQQTPCGSQRYTDVWTIWRECDRSGKSYIYGEY